MKEKYKDILIEISTMLSEIYDFTNEDGHTWALMYLAEIKGMVDTVLKEE